MTRVASATTGAALLAAPVAAQPAAPPAAPPTGAAPAVEHGTAGEGALARPYTLVVPAAVAAGRARPAGLLVFLHGCTQDAANARRGTGLDAEAGRAGLLVLYPEQPASANAQRCWNWFDPAHQRRDAGEPATLAAMTRQVAAAHGVAGGAVHVAGISAGGAMALVLAAHYPELYASVASHSGVPLGAARTPAEAWAAMRAGGAADPAPVRVARDAAGAGGARRVVPLLVLHGSSDGVVSVRNGRATAEQWAAAAEARADAAERDTPAGEGTRAWRESRWLRDGAPVVRLVVVDGLGHAWSGGSPAGTFTDALGPSAAGWVVTHAMAHGARAR
jgi:poly(hydroxyalkanoate) depolymerase family esterase